MPPPLLEPIRFRVVHRFRVVVVPMYFAARSRLQVVPEQVNLAEPEKVGQIERLISAILPGAEAWPLGRNTFGRERLHDREVAVFGKQLFVLPSLVERVLSAGARHLVAVVQPKLLVAGIQGVEPIRRHNFKSAVDAENKTIGPLDRRHVLACD